MDLFNFEKERFYFKKKKISLFEAFSGVGTQTMALKRLGLEIEHIGISEIDKYAIASYMAIHGDVKNYGDIMKINGKDLPQIDLFTWSFPCTDLSKAGKQLGLDGTRSGLGYEVLRIVSEMKVKPTMLVMENVPDLLSPKFKDGWREMYHEIENMGYTNYVEVLNAKDYGVAQNRERVFMVSILGDYQYTFPQPFKLEKRLKDYLEPKVDEKYYLSEETILRISKWKAQQKPLENVLYDNSISPTLTARGAGEEHSGMVLYGEPKRIFGLYDGEEKKHQAGSVYDVMGLSPTIDTMQGGNREPLIIEPKMNYAPQSRDYKENGWSVISQTLLARDYKDPKIVKLDDFRIRKVTPLECWRLMGIDDDDYYKAQRVCSNSQLYKQAGNAIVVDVLHYIFKQLF